MVNRSYRVYAGADIIDQGMHNVTWVQVRLQRNQALEDSDWRAVKDRTMSQAWKDYRQALRDLPQEHEESNDAADAWPEAPE
jgi:hypothetical protein